jgi:hypothetical protein
MSWFVLTLIGVLVNSLGLWLFGDAIVHRTVEAGAPAAGLGDSLLALLLINAGILLMIEGMRRRRP